MIFIVRCMRNKGRPIAPAQLRRQPEIRGDIIINHESNVMGRSAVVARLRGGLPNEPDKLPELMDATLHTMGPIAFVLTGTEVIDGAAYAQSWLCNRE